MFTGWQYRIVSSLGVLVLTVGAVLVANHHTAQLLFTSYVPLFDRLEATVLTGRSLYWAIALSLLTVVGSLVPLYKPQPRRLLDTVFLAQRRVIVAGLALATLGYFKWSYRLPRATLVMTIGLLTVAIPVWFVWICHHPVTDPDRVLVVGDDREQIEQTASALSVPVLGYLSPPHRSDHEEPSIGTVADGGTTTRESVDGTGSRTAIDDMIRLGGLSRLENTFVEYDVDTVVVAFHRADRAEFFGTLDTCHEHGIDVSVHREYADCVLVSERTAREFVDVEIEPWDPLDHLFKRVFDIAFALGGLLAFAPLMIVITIAIKLDSPGPVLYNQERTAGFGDTFSVYKFRSMESDGECAAPTVDHDYVTRVGRVLRKTHLDELPQLWSILIGDMSVVGPRAVWTREELLLEETAPAWRKRWFVKPGLTGLAQVNDAKSADPNTKLRYDLEYIQRQSFWFDLKIVIRQLWKVLRDVR